MAKIISAMAWVPATWNDIKEGERVRLMRGGKEVHWGHVTGKPKNIFGSLHFKVRLADGQGEIKVRLDDWCQWDIEVIVLVSERVRSLMAGLKRRAKAKEPAIAFTLQGGPYAGQQALFTNQKNTLPIDVGPWVGHYNANGIWMPAGWVGDLTSDGRQKARVAA